MNMSLPQSHDGRRKQLLPLSEEAKAGVQSNRVEKSSITPIPATPRNVQSIDFVIRSGIAGGLAGCAAKTLIAPLDRVKILFQTSSPQFEKYTGSWFGFATAARNIYRQDGLLGMFRGHSMTLVRIFPYSGIKFIMYEQVRALLIQTKEQETMWRRLASGAAAGVTSVLLTYPLEVVRVRLAFETKKDYKASIPSIFKQIYHEHPPQTSSPSIPSSTSVAYKIAQNASSAVASAANATLEAIPAPVTSRASGIANFYRGFSPTLLGMVPYAGTSFLVHDLMGDLLRSPSFSSYCVIPNSGTNEAGGYSRSQRPKLKIWAQLFAGGFAGLASQTASYPLEIIRRRMQVGGVVGSGKFLGITETARIIYRQKGIRGFYVGLSIGFIKIVPMTATSFLVYERMRPLLGV